MGTTRFEGRSVVVTGGASGFGKATAARFARGGASVTIVDVAGDGGAVADELSGDGGSVTFHAADVSDPDALEIAFQAAFDRAGRLDVAINNAGILGGGWIHEDGATEHLRRQLDVNVVGVWNGCRAALRLMRPQRSGVIVNTASPAAQVPTPGAVAYGLCKSAVLHLTHSLAIGYAPDNVRVNAVLPGPAITGIYNIDESQRPALEQAYLQNIPLGRLAHVDDIAAAIEYLASDEASYVTGAALNVDGGFRPRLRRVHTGMTADVIVERDVEIRRGDDEVLRADVYRPADAEPHPVLLQYTAYNKSNWVSVFGVINPLRAVGSGFAVVVVDALGRFGSGGDAPFRPFAEDGEAAVATIEWIARQPWSTGAIGMYGASNNGVPQWQAAKLGPPALQAIAPHFTASEYDEGWVYRGGAFQLGFNAWWTMTNLAPDMLARARRRGCDVDDATQAIAAAQRDPDAVFRCDPADALGPVEPFVPHYRDWLRHGHGDPFWTPTSLAGAWDSIDLPILHVAGWYNVHLDGNLANFRAMREKGPDSVRDRQHLIIGPWTQWQPALGEACGPEQRYPTAVFDMEGTQLEWFRAQLAGDAPVELPRARVFVMGAAEWRDYTDWPPPEVATTGFHLDSEGGANTRSGDGRLAPIPAVGAASDRFVHDPADPVPTVGGATMLPNFTVTAGQRDQAGVEDRTDVLVYSTLPLAERLTVVGPVLARLWVSASEPTADLCVKLVDVHPDGRAMLLCDGITRIGEITEPLTPGEPSLVEVDVLATANVFLPGHRLRIEVAGSCYPKFDLHAQRAGSGTIAEPVRTPVAVTVWHDHEHPSLLLVPVVPETEVAS